MKTVSGKKLTIVTHERELYHGKPLFQVVLDLLAGEGIASTAVTRGIAGFVGSCPVHTANIEVLSFDLPLVIEATDVSGKIDRLLPLMAQMCAAAIVDVMQVEFVSAKSE